MSSTANINKIVNDKIEKIENNENKDTENDVLMCNMCPKLWYFMTCCGVYTQCRKKELLEDIQVDKIKEIASDSECCSEKSKSNFETVKPVKICNDPDTVKCSVPPNENSESEQEQEPEPSPKSEPEQLPDKPVPIRQVMEHVQHVKLQDSVKNEEWQELDDNEISEAEKSMDITDGEPAVIVENEKIIEVSESGDETQIE